MNSLETTIITGVLALNGTLVAALIWVVKTVIGKLGTDTRDNTKVLGELRDYQKQHARAQLETNSALNDLIQIQRECASRTTGE